MLYPFLPAHIKLPPSGRISLSVEGKKLKLETNQTNYLTQLIYWNGYRNFEYTEIFLKLIKQVDSFFDIGANIGYYSLLAARVKPEIKIVAFEPAIGPLHFLQKNVELNQFTNIEIAPVALSDQNGEITFYEVESEKYLYLKYNLAGEGNAGSKTTERNFVKNIVPTTTLDEYLAANKVKNIDLIKIDTEGTEHLILEYSKKVLTEMKPIIICETLFGKIEGELDIIMKSYGYEFYNHVGKGLQKVESIKRKEDNDVLNCFFVHPTKKHLIEPFIV